MAFKPHKEHTAEKQPQPISYGCQVQPSIIEYVNCEIAVTTLQVDSKKSLRTESILRGNRRSRDPQTQAASASLSTTDCLSAAAINQIAEAPYLWEILVPTSRPDGRPILARSHRLWDRAIYELCGGLTILTPT